MKITILNSCTKDSSMYETLSAYASFSYASFTLATFKPFTLQARFRVSFLHQGILEIDSLIRFLHLLQINRIQT